jgi:hypothetical protein
MQPRGNVTLLVDRGGESAQSIELPVYESDDLYARWFVDNVPPVPVDVQRAFQRLGLEVRRDRHWAPVHVEGQRQVMVPIDQVEIVPVRFVP